MLKVETIIVAGGLGRRMQQLVPKAFLSLGHHPLFILSLLTMERLPEISGMVLVVPAGEEEHARRLCAAQTDLKKVRAIVAGGSRRQDSVRQGMDCVAPDTEIILVHDAARPFCSERLVRSVIAAAQATGAAIPGIPMADSLKRVDDKNQILQTVDRRNLMAVQTPQGFRREILFRAYQQAWAHQLTATDDASLVEQLGLPVVVVEGETGNFKITCPQDLELAEFWLEKNSRAIG